ncbi:TPA: hydrogenase membrane subunit [Candidatus Woesearchaeota archaeon]|nr:hydrogenase membrane subunit [Candidatus Woesearchaeota archaeon]
MMPTLFFQSGVGLLLIASFLALVFLHVKQSRIRKCFLALIILACVLFLASSLSVLLGGDALAFYLMLSGLRVSLSIDVLAAFFIGIIGLVGLSVAIYSLSYVEHVGSERKKNFMLSMMAVFILSMVLVVASHHLLGFLVFWELMSISSLFLVLIDFEKEETRKAGIFYFVMTQLSTVFLIFAFALIYNHAGTLEIITIRGLPPFIASLVFVSLALGFGIKAGAIPFHKWLPYAHPASPSPISALMSGVMIKVAIYGIVRFILLLPDKKLWWGILILILGTSSALLGVIYALKEHDLKRLLAYHSIENIGIILIGIGLYMLFSWYSQPAIALLALFAALFHTLNHALFKSLLFLSAGSVVHATHTKNIEKMGGLMKTMPYTAALFLIGAISISALPPLNGFVSELMLFQVFFSSGVIASPMMTLVLFFALSLFALTSALAAACFVKAFGIVFLALPRSKEAEMAKESGPAMILGQAILAVLCIGLGVFSFQIFQQVGQKAGISFDLPNLLLISATAVFIGAVIFIAVRGISNRNVRISETWGCGIASQNSRMEYTASGFSDPILTIFSSIYRTKKINRRSFHDHDSAVFKEGHAEVLLLRFFEEYLYLPVVRLIRFLSSFLYKVQNKVELDPYLLSSFVAILALLPYRGLAIR